jgi:O-acetyl-ADP-ribose deacetylase (regulator of RNase III)
VTQAYWLPSKIIIHTVGPVWQGGGEGKPALLESCYINSIHLAINHDARTIAFPAISTGVYAYPIEQASKIACCAVKKALAEYPVHVLEKVWFVCFNKTIADAYQRNMDIFDL